MASSTTQLSFPSMKSDKNELEVGAFQTNDAILMSLLEEFQEEERDDEDRVNSLIQSLEAEITSPSATMVNSGSGSIDSELSIRDFQDGDAYDCSGSSVDSELGWFDMDQVPCSPSDDMNWYMDSCEYEMECLNDAGIWVGDYSHICYETGLEENGYNSAAIWQETAYDTIMYD